MPPDRAWALTSLPSITRPQSGYRQSASPALTVPGLWSLALVTISNVQCRCAGFSLCGTTRTPVPLLPSFQFGDSGTTPSQYGQRIVRAQSQLVATQFGSGSGGKKGAS